VPATVYACCNNCRNRLTVAFFLPSARSIETKSLTSLLCTSIARIVPKCSRRRLIWDCIGAPTSRGMWRFPPSLYSAIKSSRIAETRTRSGLISIYRNRKSESRSTLHLSRNYPGYLGELES